MYLITCLQLGHPAVFYLDTDFSEVQEDQEEDQEEVQEDQEDEEQSQDGAVKTDNEDLVSAHYFLYWNTL